MFTGEWKTIVNTSPFWYDMLWFDYQYSYYSEYDVDMDTLTVFSNNEHNIDTSLLDANYANTTYYCALVNLHSTLGNVNTVLAPRGWFHPELSDQNTPSSCILIPRQRYTILPLDVAVSILIKIMHLTV